MSKLKIKHVDKWYEMVQRLKEGPACIVLHDLEMRLYVYKLHYDASSYFSVLNGDMTRHLLLYIEVVRPPVPQVRKKEPEPKPEEDEDWGSGECF